MNRVVIPAQMPANAAGETVHGFGDGLVGVVSHPRGQAQRTAVVLFNAGLVQRAGPFRGYTLLARKLAALGFPVLRLDHGGLGDSAPCTVSTAERRATELRAALDLLQLQTGAERFVLGGICAGADEAFHASADPRIAGLLLLDGLAYRTPGFWWRYLLPRLFNLTKLRRMVRRARSKEAGMSDYRDFPSQDQAKQVMVDLAARDVKLLFLFTGGAYDYFNHADQLAACLGPAAKSANVSLALWADCDHTFFLQRDRQRLHRLVADWMQANFAAARGQ